MTKMTIPANSLAPVQRARGAALLNYFSLFSSFSTLICCALPSVLVLLGMGTTVASLLSAAPWLVSLSRHKIWTFSIAGVLIAMSFVMTYLVGPHLRRGDVCDADDPTTCGEVNRISRVILWGSAVIWSCGFFVAYLLGPIFERMDR
jgi:mercuric ion transport protein